MAADYAFVTITVPAFAVGQEGKDPPKAAAFSVENKGAVDAEIESVKLEGENAKSFKLSSEKGATVKAGKTNSSSWTLRPVSGLEKGVYTASVVHELHCSMHPCGHTPIRVAHLDELHRTPFRVILPQLLQHFII